MKLICIHGIEWDIVTCSRTSFNCGKGCSFCCDNPCVTEPISKQINGGMSKNDLD